LKTYLKSAHLKGFRTIKDLSVDFNPGLNIIIGKNGTGKTNFLTFLDKMARNEFIPFMNSFSKLTFNGEKSYSVINDQNFDIDLVFDHFKTYFDEKGKYEVSIGSDLHKFNSKEQFQAFIVKEQLKPLVLFIPHGIRSREQNGVIDSPFSFSYSGGNLGIDNLLEIYNNKNNSWFLRSLAMSLFVDLFFNEGPIDNSFEKNQRKVFAKINNICERINGSIGNYLPIDEVRISSAFKVYNDSSDGLTKFEHLSFEYLIDGSWLPFSSLSDGTKRLFCIYADLLADNDFYDDFVRGYNGKSPLILIEEPELGIHPHQFHLIMTLLKELSKESQIIITTHAPQALNIFNQDELDSIYLCTHDAEKGTQVKHMSEEQQEKAKFYMEDLYLSDYWLTSNFDL